MKPVTVRTPESLRESSGRSRTCWRQRKTWNKRGTRTRGPISGEPLQLLPVRCESHEAWIADTSEANRAHLKAQMVLVVPDHLFFLGRDSPPLMGHESSSTVVVAVET